MAQDLGVCPGKVVTALWSLASPESMPLTAATLFGGWHLVPPFLKNQAVV